MSEAGDRCFVDTNVLLYSFDPAGAAKHMLARRWLNFLWSAGSGRISWQVLNEFYANAVRKTGVPTATARKSVEALAAWQPMGVHIALVRRAWHWMDHAGLSYWDSLILAAAESLGCRWLLSEDFQAGRRLGLSKWSILFRRNQSNSSVDIHGRLVATPGTAESPCHSTRSIAVQPINSAF